MTPEARDILEKNIYCVMATVCPDGAPWNTPLRFAFDDTHLYWCSHAATQHMRNLERNDKAFVVVNDISQGSIGAVYIATTVKKLAGEEAEKARKVYGDRFKDSNAMVAAADIYGMPIGKIDSENTKDRRIYFRSAQ